MLRPDDVPARGQRDPRQRGHGERVRAAMVEGAANAIGCAAALALARVAWSFFQSKTSVSSYGRDMTADVARDLVVGRDDEMDSIIDILCHRTKNNAALVGEAGVGKTAIVEGLAQRIAAGDVPPALAGARLVEVDLGAMTAGTVLRGMFEERIKSVIAQAEASDGNTILFFDEMHMLCGAGEGITKCTSAANLLKPALARGRIRCIGATTFDEYRTYIEKDPALERRFQKVHVNEPTTEATIDILRGLKQRYQDHHGVDIQDAALVAAARLAARYITGTNIRDFYFNFSCIFDGILLIGYGENPMLHIYSVHPSLLTSSLAYQTDQLLWYTLVLCFFVLHIIQSIDCMVIDRSNHLHCHVSIFIGFCCCLYCRSSISRQSN
jgi:ATP-dependent Clp protease ATP-binding subunit ClpA